ncbi:secretion protein, partial [Alcaligenes pakistanensis]
VERGGLVRSQIEVEVSSVDASLSQPAGPSLKTRRASTEFNVRSGQTLVLAGFISREESRHV